eukprot:6489030-Amphidinium_carterae.1
MHDDTVRKGFPTYTHCLFERPVFRRQQSQDGAGPFYCCNVGTGELRSMDEFKPVWIKRNVSQQGQAAAFVYLNIWNNWTETSVQATPITHIGVCTAGFAERAAPHVHEPQRTGAHTHAVDHPYPRELDGRQQLTYGRHHETNSIDIAEGKDAGEMILQDMWFEESLVRKDGRNTDNIIIW